MSYNCNYIFLIIIKNTLSLFISTKHSKNNILISNIWNIISSRSIFKLIDLIKIILPILNMKLANLTIILSS